MNSPQFITTQPRGLLLFCNYAKNLHLIFAFLGILLHFSINPAYGFNIGATEIDDQNLHTILTSSELVFLNFYADWCPFSSMLTPIFNQAADQVKLDFPTSKIVLGRVNSDKQASISSHFNVTKFPTLRLIRNGIPVKKEYRGARTVEAFLEYIKQQLANPIQEFKSIEELKTKLDMKKRNFIGYLNSNSGPIYETYKKIAMVLRDDCQFYAGYGATTTASNHGMDLITFHPDRARSFEKDEGFVGNPTNFDQLYSWIHSKCLPLVREITFENAEELAEAGIPFLILFHHPTDNEIVKRYKLVIQNELQSEKDEIMFLHADGDKFKHPLQHLGKTPADLPLIAIDSFSHMYLFKDINNMERPGMLKKFIHDLHSGKLHTEFHFGVTDDGQENTNSGEAPTSPPESVFVKLGPSSDRYTLIRDEL